MHRIASVGCSALLLAIASALAGSASAQDDRRTEPVQLAAQLGARDFRDRETAGQRLDERGADALPALRTVAETGNLEASGRAEALIAKIEKRLANDKAIAGMVVELKAEEQELSDAIDELRSQTGFAIRFGADRTPLSKRVTPKAGKAFFWDAVQDLMDQAELEVDLCTGTVLTLKARTLKAAKPHCISGRFRLEAIPIPAGELAATSAGTIPLLVQVMPEPRVHWLGTINALLGRAIDQERRSLPWDFGVYAKRGAPSTMDDWQVRGGSSHNHNPVSVVVTSFQTLVKLKADPAGSSTRLKEFGGVVRGRAWSDLEPIVAVTKLGGSFREADDGKRTRLKAKCEPIVGEPSVLLLTVTLKCTWSQYHSPNGMTLLDGGGRTMKLSAHLRPEMRSEQRTDDSGTYESVEVQEQFIFRPTEKGESAKPATLTFSASRIVMVEIPFQFQDVPVQAGGVRASAPVERIHGGIR